MQYPGLTVIGYYTTPNPSLCLGYDAHHVHYDGK